MPSEDLSRKVILKGHALDLNHGTLREGLDSNAAARRLMAAEVLLVDAIHTSEIVHIGKEDGRLQDAVKGRAGGMEDGGEIFENGFGAFLNGSGDNVALLV